jgi:hypothetical protein
VATIFKAELDYFLIRLFNVYFLSLKLETL